MNPCRDDEPLFLEVLDFLKDMSFADVTPIYSTKEALRELGSGKKGFDCVLLDIRMPGTSGVELCRKIRAIAGHKRTPIMMISALIDRAYIDDAFAAGASDYLTKPLDPLELKVRMSMIERLVAEQSRNIFLEQSVEASADAEDDEAEIEALDFGFDTALAMRATGSSNIPRWRAISSLPVRTAVPPRSSRSRSTMPTPSSKAPVIDYMNCCMT